MKRKFFSILLLAVVLTAGAFAFLNPSLRNNLPENEQASNEKNEKGGKQDEPVKQDDAAKPENAPVVAITPDEDDPHHLIEGVWIVEDYTFKILSEEAKGASINLEDAKANKTKHYFKGGKAGGDEQLSEVLYDFKDGKIYLWSPREVDSRQLSENVMKNPRVQIYDYKFTNDGKMILTMANEHVTLEAVYVKIN